MRGRERQSNVDHRGHLRDGCALQRGGRRCLMCYSSVHRRPIQLRRQHVETLQHWSHWLGHGNHLRRRSSLRRNWQALRRLHTEHLYLQFDTAVVEVQLRRATQRGRGQLPQREPMLHFNRQIGWTLYPLRGRRYPVLWHNANSIMSRRPKWMEHRHHVYEWLPRQSGQRGLLRSMPNGRRSPMRPNRRARFDQDMLE